MATYLIHQFREVEDTRPLYELLRPFNRQEARQTEERNKRRLHARREIEARNLMRAANQ